MIDEMIANTKKLAQWQGGDDKITNPLLADFFACVLCQVHDEKMRLWYDHFLKSTQGGDDVALASFWQPTTLTLKQQLAKHYDFCADTLHQRLPLAVHTGFGALQALAKNEAVTLQAYIARHSAEAVARLPSWADEVLGEMLVAKLQVEYLLISVLDEEPKPQNASVNAFESKKQQSQQADTQNHLDDSLTHADVIPKPAFTPKTSLHPWLLAGLGAGILLLLMAVGFYIYQQKKATQTTLAEHTVNQQAVVATNGTPFLSLTVSESGDLYACHATLADDAQSQALMQVLEVHFAGTMCVIDINQQLSANFAGFDKLKSVIGLLKSAPHATLQFRDGEIFINAPDSEDLTRLVADVGAIMAGTQVSAMTSRDDTAWFQNRLTQALATMSVGDEHQLATAMTLVPLSSKSTVIDERLGEALSVAASQLVRRPHARFIIAVHSDETGDPMTAREQTQAVAQAIKEALMAQGVKDDQLVAQGVGYDFPMMDNQTDIGRSYNNRVEFLVYDETVMQALTTPINPIAPAPVFDTGITTPSNFQVIDGQIVDLNSPQGQALLAQQQQQQYTPPPEAMPQYTPPPQYAPPPSQYTPPPPSPIPDDLLTEIGVN